MLLPKDNFLLSWNESFPKLKKTLLLFLVIVSISGSLIDSLTLSYDLSNAYYYVQGIFILSSIVFTFLYLIKLIKLKTTSFLIIYSILVNILINLLLNESQPDFEKLFLREMIIASVLIVPAGFLIDKIHVISIGLIIPLLFPIVFQKQEIDFIHSNIAILALVFVSYVAVIYFLINLMDKWYIQQQELIIELEQSNISLAEKGDELNETNKTKDRLFSIIAHDLRNPFNSILGFSDLIIKSGDKLTTEKKEKYLNLINQSAEESIVLLDNLFNWATSQTQDINFNPMELKVDSILKNIQSYFTSNSLEKEISISIHSEENLTLFADRNMLTTILRNLISNALKFTPRNGSINIVVQKKTNEVLFSVSDSGIGINSSDKEKLFQLDYQIQTPGTENESGSGLGLIICGDFVQRHGGTIWVESVENKGATFSFTIPIKI